MSHSGREADDEFHSDDDSQHDLHDEFDDDFDAWDEEDEEAEYVPCSRCGRQVYRDALQCPACGEYVAQESAFSGKPWWWIVLGLAGVLAVILLSIFF